MRSVLYIIGFAIVLVFGSLSCAKRVDRPRPTQTLPTQPSLEDHSAETEYFQQDPKPSAKESPASALVRQGMSLLQTHQDSQAEWKFEEAINIDPDYGPAYYWLARARFRNHELEGAMEMLRKAQDLLRDSTLWQQRIREFKEFLIKQAR